MKSIILFKRKCLLLPFFLTIYDKSLMSLVCTQNLVVMNLDFISLTLFAQFDQKLHFHNFLNSPPLAIF